METPVMFNSAEGISLEALLSRSSGSSGVIVTHPHSLYGGNMENPVVEAITRVYADKGFTTLRFNFRGVGKSDGVFAEGSGEQLDVSGAIEYLLREGIERVHLVGYSFGARVLAGMSHLPPQVCLQLHVAPPVAFMDYDSITHIGKLRQVIAGQDDDIAPPDAIRARIEGWNTEASFAVIRGADHFFSRTMGEFKRVLAKFVDNVE